MPVLMELTERFSEAVTLALELHRDQRRKVTGVPYASHLLRVTGIALEHGADEDTAEHLRHCPPSDHLELA